MPRRMLVPFLLFTAFAIVFGCSSSDDPTTPPVDSGADEYLADLPTWEEFSPPLETADIAIDTSTACLDVVEEARYLCVETPKSLTDTPQDVVTFDAGGDVLWPGALIQGISYRDGVGSMLELGIRQRAPLTISISLLTEDNTRTVANPTLATVKSAIGELIDAAMAAGHQPGGAIHFEKTEAYSREQLALDLGISARFLGTSVRSKLSVDALTETNTLAANFVQRMFTITMVQPQTPEAIFSEEFTQERLQEQIDLGRIGPGNLPVYVSQVVYGRMMIMKMTSTYSESEMMASLEASYAAVNANTHFETDEVYANSTFEVAAVGGSAASVQGLIISGDLADYFAEVAPLSTAEPISYTLRNLADNEKAYVSETTSYTERTCSAVEVHLMDVETQWRDAVQGQEGDVIYPFVPSAANLNLSEEVNWLTGSSNINTGTTTFTFLGANTGFPFDFMVTKSTAGTYTYNDTEDGNAFSGCEFPHLSPGDADNYDDDDIDIIVTRVDPGLAISGIAVNVGHNTLSAEEYLEVRSPTGLLLEIFDQDDPLPDSVTGYNFMGVASPLPLKRIFFNEDMGGDDICFQNIWIAVRTGD